MNCSCGDKMTSVVVLFCVFGGGWNEALEGIVKMGWRTNSRLNQQDFIVGVKCKGRWAQASEAENRGDQMPTTEIRKQDQVQGEE